MPNWHVAFAAAFVFAGLPIGLAAGDGYVVLAQDSFDDGMGGWRDYEVDDPAYAEGESGYPPCSGDYADAVVGAGSAGSPAVRKGPEEGQGISCWVGMLQAFNTEGVSELRVSFDARAVSSTHLSTVTNAVVAVGRGGVDPYDGVDDLLLDERPVNGGTTDSGWGHFGPYTVAVAGAPSVSVFLGTNDGWTADWDKEAWFDNVLVEAVLDDDGDGVGNGADNCPATYNPGQRDGEGDGDGDACDGDDDNDCYSDASEDAAGSDPGGADSIPTTAGPVTTPMPMTGENDPTGNDLCPDLAP